MPTSRHSLIALSLSGVPLPEVHGEDRRHFGILLEVEDGKKRSKPMKRLLKTWKIDRNPSESMEKHEKNTDFGPPG